MAKITLKHLKHSYIENPSNEEDFALKEINAVWEDGGAYALLGPSGCGKTTLLNIISGLLTPTTGKILFNEDNVTETPTTERDIAQVFQFPVVYDTMTVFNNLAFPLRNRGYAEDKVRKRVEQVAEMLELTDSLQTKAAGLTADGKQKISLGRGLVREDLNVIMFDEPLTVIDPHLKWKLRSKLKELHQRIGTTMIYVTHDQTEALTFADQVVVMYEGTVVQIGTPIELFERPKHTFVGHFIGSPGMNILPVSIQNDKIMFEGNELQLNLSLASLSADQHALEKMEIGIRPEFIHFNNADATDGIPVDVIKVIDLGKYRIVEVKHKEHLIKVVIYEDDEVPSENPTIYFDSKRTWLYSDSWIVE